MYFSIQNGYEDITDFGLIIWLDPSVSQKCLYECDAGDLWFYVFPHNFASFTTNTPHAALRGYVGIAKAGTIISPRSPPRGETKTMVLHQY